EVVRTAHAPGGLAGTQQRRQQQANEDGDDRDHNQQRDERERAAFPGSEGSEHRYTCCRSPGLATVYTPPLDWFCHSDLSATLASPWLPLPLPEARRWPSGLNARP